MKRDRALIALSVAVLVLGVAISTLVALLIDARAGQRDFERGSLERSALASAQREDQSRKLDALTAQVASLTADNAAKDRQISSQADTIRTLTLILRREGIAIPMSLTEQIDAGTGRTTTRPSTSSPAPTASPTPSTTPAPGSTPRPGATPSPTGLVPTATGLVCLLVPFAC